MKLFIKKLSALFVSIVLLFMLSGCANMNLSLKINADGSADWGLKLLLSDSALEQAGTDIWDDVKAELAAQGCTVADIKGEGSAGISATRHFQKVEDLGEGQGTESIFSGANPVFTVKTNKDFFTTTYDIHAAIDTSEMAQLPAQAGEAGGMMEQALLTMEVVLPAKASAHNATTVLADGLTYTWVLSPTQANSIELSASVPNTGNILLAGGGVVLILAAAATIMAFAAKRRKAPRVADKRAASRIRQ